MRRLLAALAAFFISHSALAQTFPAGWNQVGPSVAITASGSSSTVKLGWVGAQQQAPPLAHRLQVITAPLSPMLRRHRYPRPESSPEQPRFFAVEPRRTRLASPYSLEALSTLPRSPGAVRRAL